MNHLTFRTNSSTYKKLLLKASMDNYLLNFELAYPTDSSTPLFKTIESTLDTDLHNSKGIFSSDGVVLSFHFDREHHALFLTVIKKPFHRSVGSIQDGLQEEISGL